MNCEKHYCLPPLSRFDLPEILSLIAQEKYFVLHAPRQSGKTSCLLALRDHLNREGNYIALYINVEGGQTARGDVRKGIKAILSELGFQAERTLGDATLRERINTGFNEFGENAAFKIILSNWCTGYEKPLVLCIDEVDALVGDTLISLLRQIRSGYPERPVSFPASVILCGVRDVRDYRIHSEKDREIITGGSAFNIKAESLRLGNFSEEETWTLCLQHTKETGQVFEDEALAAIWHLTCGQPWLVNALAYEVCFKLEEGKDRKNPITSLMVEEAKERLIQRRETHLDQLVDKLKEERVRGVIGPILEGTRIEDVVSEDDIGYVMDLGLITRRSGGLVIANPIYQEIIPRAITYITQLNLEPAVNPGWYIGPLGRLDMQHLLSSFQQFFRENSASWTDIANYKESGPQLLLQAYLQRIINSGGQITREYGLGMGRTDLFIFWHLPDGNYQRFVIECKVMRGSREATITSGVTQVLNYADSCGADEVYLVIFDKTKKKSWDKKIFAETRELDGVPVTVFGM